MENVRNEFAAVEDYSISETSLEQVFISFAKKQKSTENPDGKTKPENEDDVDGGPVHQRKLVRYLSAVSRVSEKVDSSEN